MASIEFLDPVVPLVLPDHTDHGWGFESLGAWYSLSADKSERRERPTAHGAFRARRSLRSALTFEVVAHFVGGSPAELVEALEYIGALGADGPIVMRVTDHVRTTEREVSVIDIDVPSYQSRRINTVTISLWAADPRRYSVGDQWVSGSMPEEATSGLTWPIRWPLIWGTGGASDGRLTLTNHGTKASAPVYRVYGGFDSVELVEISSQQRIGFDLIVPAGSYVEIDFRTRRATLNGQSDVSRYLTFREWWTVPAGGSVQVAPSFEGAGPSAAYSGMVRSAW